MDLPEDDPVPILTSWGNKRSFNEQDKVSLPEWPWKPRPAPTQTRIDTSLGVFNFLPVPGMRDDVAFVVTPEDANRLAHEAMMRVMEEHFFAQVMPDYLHMPVTPDMPYGHPAIKAKAMHPGWISTGPEACANVTEAELKDLLQMVVAQRKKQPDLIITELREQFRFPRSKKRRIQRKWSKRPCNWRPLKQIGGLLDPCHGKLYVTPENARRIQENFSTPTD